MHAPPHREQLLTGVAIYELFSGSGTTIIAAEVTGRSCHAIELNPAYVDLPVIRWQDLAGHAAALEGDDRSFGELNEQAGGAVVGEHRARKVW